jgi:hypothetical protein
MDIFCCGIVRVFGRTYENCLWHVHKQFSAFFNKFVMIAYEKSLLIIRKQLEGLFGLVYVSLSTDICICETVWENLREQSMTCLQAVFSL